MPTRCSIEPALDGVSVHTRRDAVMFDNPEAEGIQYVVQLN